MVKAFGYSSNGGPDVQEFLDLEMPSVGGIDVLQTLRSDALTESIPIVILTGSGAERDRIDAAHLGAVGFVTKPIRLEDLKVFWPK